MDKFKTLTRSEDKMNKFKTLTRFDFNKNGKILFTEVLKKFYRLQV